MYLMNTDDPVRDFARYDREQPHIEDVDGVNIYEGDAYYEIPWGGVYTRETLEQFRKTYLPE